MRWISIAVLLLIAGDARASKPIPWTMKGCVHGGVFYAIDQHGAEPVRSMGTPLDVSKLEGKYIEVAGLLYPGDYFKHAAAGPTVKRACSAADRKAIEYARAHELRMQAGRVAHAGNVDGALQLVEASIRLVQPADCDTYIDRAHLFARKRDLGAAAKDVARLKARKCRYRGQLNWLLLHELGNELRARGADKTAVEALTLALANCKTDLCKPDIARDLAAAKQAARK